MKLLGGFAPQENPVQSAPNDVDGNVQAPRQEAPKQTPPAPVTESGHNVMADVIARHEQIAARARRKQ